MVATEYSDSLTMNTLKGNVERAMLQRGKPHPTARDKGTEESEENEGEQLNVRSMNGDPTSRSCC